MTLSGSLSVCHDLRASMTSCILRPVWIAIMLPTVLFVLIKFAARHGDCLRERSLVENISERFHEAQHMWIGRSLRES